jgi:integrase
MRVRPGTRACEPARLFHGFFVHPDGTRIKNLRYAWDKACRLAGVPSILAHGFVATRRRPRRERSISAGNAL